MCVYCHDLCRSRAIIEETKKKDGLPQSRQDEASRSLTARRCRKNKRQLKDDKRPREAPSLSSSSLKNASCSSRSLYSHPEASLASPSPSPATGGPDVLPTSVVARKTRTVWLHRSSASSSAILVRPRPRVGPGSFLVSSRTAAQRVFCWLRHWGKFLERFTGLDAVLAPPAFHVRASGRPLEVLSGKAMTGRSGRRGGCWHLLRWRPASVSCSIGI